MTQANREMPVPQRPHGLTLEHRSNLKADGVEEVESFDENMVVLHTARGILVVRGSGLHLRMLSPEQGSIAVDGQIESLIYEEEKPSGGFWSRLWG